ncbi:DNA polymerase V [Candida viswanathii]|uniref:DNA polymerase V n=1 Tax=Candida viswanathii TaxID=5486 RepID=A0A367YIS3_9ASCO|nr:DNA polymerase V [Candida viswanathii]
MSVLRDHYFKLGSDVPQERLTAATQLISELISANDSSEWEYALNRLIKGIITTRQSAKFGFSMALTEVVNELIKKDELTVGKYLDLLVETTKISSAMKGKEQRAVLFGRLFGLQVLINSKIVLKSKDEKDVLLFVEVLLELSNFKNWIRETGFFTLIQFIKLLQDDDDESVDYKKKVYVKILTMVNNLGLNLSTEGLAVYLSIPNSDKLSQKIGNLKANWKEGDPFHKGNLPVLAKVLKDVEVINDEESEENGNNKKQKSSWNSRLPFVWDLIVLKFNQLDSTSNSEDDVDAVQTSESSKKRKKKESSKKSKKAKTDQEYITIKEFWKVVVDETLFSEKSSYERKYWGFEIFEKFITSLSNHPSSIQYLFTPNFMRCLINQHASSARMLYKISQLTIKTLVKITKEKQYLAPIVLSCLLDESKGGCWNFDLISKSRTIDEILQTKSQVNQFIAILLSNFESKLESQNVVEDSDKNSNDNILKWYLDKIVNLIKHNKQVQLSDTIIESILTKLIKYAFFESNDVNVSKFLQSVAKERLSSVLSELITTRLSNSKYTTWSTFCFETIKELSKSEKCLVEFDEDLAVVEQQTSDLLNTIIELNKASSDKLYIFELLFSMCLIQLYMEDEETVQVINELKLVFENQFAGKTEDDDEDQVDDSVVLTEIVLSFISRKSTLFKKLSTLVWENFLCKTNDTTEKLRVNDACFRLLFDVLEARENKQGQQKLFEGEGGEVEEEDEEEEDNDGDNESEEDQKEEDDAEDEDEDEDEGEDSDLEDVNDTMTELDKQTNLKLAQALGIPTKESGEVKFDELDDLTSDEEYESDSMDDEQMMAMDDELSRIFKHRQDTLNSLPTGNKRKLEVLEAKENMVFFKNRILDLLEIFNRVNGSLHYNLTFIEPLITLMNLTLDKNLGVKAHKLLKNKVSKTKIEPEELAKYYADPAGYYTSLIQLVSDLQEKASTIKSSNQSVIQSYNQSCIVVAKNLIALDEQNMEKVVEIYSRSFKQWCLSSDSKLQSSLFFDFTNWVNSKKNSHQNNKK